MKQHLSDYIKDKYPLACRNMHGVEQLGKGWWPLIDSILRVVEQALIDNPEMPFEISQIKEKYASLRFYYSGGDDAIDELVSVAENSSSKVCEECGAPGKMRGRSWVYTACDEHTADKDK
jgi:hypothetical protein